MENSKFLKLYDLIMEDLLQNKAGNPIRLKNDDNEYKKAIDNIKALSDKITLLLSNEFQNELSKNEKIESIIKDRICIIKCPNKIREQVIKKSPFLSDEISKLIDENKLIDDSFDIKINDVEDPNEKEKDFDELENNTDDINFQVTGKSSAGEYIIPIVIRSDDNDEDFYKIKVVLYAKPNTGATKQRDGNVSITVAEFIPCLLWNLQESTSISLEEVINLISTFNVESSSYSKQGGSKNKLQNMINYFKNEYSNDPDKKIMDNKIHGAIGVYKFMVEKFSKETNGKCIWTDTDALKPEGYESNPGDIMISKGDGKYIAISLKTAANAKQSPPLLNTNTKRFLEFCNLVNTSKQYDVVKDYFYPIVNFCKENKFFTDDECNQLMAFENKPRSMASYCNNGEIKDKCLQIGPIRSFVINRIKTIIDETFNDNKTLLDYFLQVQHDDNDFYIIKAIEKPGAEPLLVSLNYSILDNFEIVETSIGLVIKGIEINGVEKKLEISIRSKGRGLYGYLGYDMVTILK